MSIVIIDYGMGNLGSIANMLKRVGTTSIITSDIDLIKKADKIILPGVGAFDRAMENINDLSLIEILNDKALREKRPILGICLGMQLMALKSEEGNRPGLGWINAEIRKFKFSNNTQLKIPHMGWNIIDIKQNHPIFYEMYPEPRFYFVHSYHAICNNKENILATANYGYEFVAAYVNENIIGVQFHPEKSHKFGMKLLKNFVEKV